MEQSEIIRRNEAIAKYMGDPRVWYGGWYSIGEMEFDCDWSCLMPVVEKVSRERDEGFHLLPAFNGEWVARFGLRVNSRRPTAIEVTWLAVSDYILSLEK